MESATRTQAGQYPADVGQHCSVRERFEPPVIREDHQDKARDQQRHSTTTSNQPSTTGRLFNSAPLLSTLLLDGVGTANSGINPYFLKSCTRQSDGQVSTFSTPMNTQQCRQEAPSCSIPHALSVGKSVAERKQPVLIQQASNERVEPQWLSRSNSIPSTHYNFSSSQTPTASCAILTSSNQLTPLPQNQRNNSGSERSMNQQGVPLYTQHLVIPNQVSLPFNAINNNIQSLVLGLNTSGGQALPGLSQTRASAATHTIPSYPPPPYHGTQAHCAIASKEQSGNVHFMGNKSGKIDSVQQGQQHPQGPYVNVGSQPGQVNHLLPLAQVVRNYAPTQNPVVIPQNGHSTSNPLITVIPVMVPSNQPVGQTLQHVNMSHQVSQKNSHALGLPWNGNGIHSVQHANMAYQLTYSLQHTLAQLPTAPESSSQQKQKAIAVVLPPSPPISPHSPFQIKATDRLTTKKPVESFPKNTTRNNTTDTVTAGIPGQISNETKSQAGTNSLQSPPLFTEPGQEDLHLRLRRPSEAETNGALALDPAATHDTGQSSPEQVNLEQSCSPVFPGGNHQLALTPTQGKNKADIDSVVNLVSENLANTERMEEERPVETFCSFPVRQVTNRKFKGMIDLLERSRYSELKAGSIPIQPESSDLSSTLLTQFWDGCSKNVQDLIDSHYYDKLMTEIIDYNRDHTLPESVIFSYLIPKDREKCHVMRHNDVYPKSVYTSSWLNTNNLLEIDEEFGLPWCLKYNQQSTPRVEQAEVVRTEDDEPGAASEMQEVMPQTESVIPGPEANVTVATPTHSCGETESPEIIECAEDDGCRQTETPEIIECAEDGSCRLTETSEIIECAEDHVPTNSPVSLVVGVQSPGEATRSFGEVQAQSERSADQQTKVLKEFDGNEIHEVYCCVPKMMAKMYGDTNFLCHCKSEPAPGKPTINVKSRGEVNIDLTGEEESYVNPATLLSKETEQQPILLSSDSSSKKGTVRRKRKRHLEGSYSPLSVQKKKRGDCNPRQIPLAIPQNANSKSDQSLTENSNQTVGHDLQHVSISRQVSLKDIRVQQCVAPESLKEQQLETTSTQRLTGKECLTSQPGSAVKLALFGSQVQQNTGQRSNPFTFRSQIPPPILNVNFGSSVRKGASLVTSMMRKSPEVKKPEFKNPEVRSSVKERLLTEWWGSYVPSKIQRRAPKKTKPFGAKPRWGTHRKSIGSYAVKATSAEILGCPPAAPNRSPRAGGSIQGILNGLKLRVAKISSS